MKVPVWLFLESSFLCLLCGSLPVLALQVVPVGDGECCSSFGYYGTCPESPDGNYLTYVTYVDPAGNGDSVVRVAAVAQVEIDYADTGSEITYAASSHYASGKGPEKTLVSWGQWLATERNEWIRYDLGAETDIRSIDIQWAGESSRSYLFKVDVASVTNGPWSTVYEGRAGTNRVDFETFDFPDTTGRYVRLTLNGWKEPCELWVCDRNLTGHRKLADFDSNAHNGGEVVWLDDAVLAFQAEPNGEINVINIGTGALLSEFLYGQISQNSSGGKLAYAVNSMEAGNWQSINGQTVAQGIYIWDLNSQRSVQVCTSSNLAAQLVAVGAADAVVTNLPPISHLQFSPDGSELALRWDGLNDEHLAIVSTNGTLISAFPDPKPLHFLWCGNDSIMGVEVSTNSYANGNYKRWSLDGEEQETLAGVMTHGAASPNYEWFAGETADYGQSPIPVVLFQRGAPDSYATVWQSSCEDIVWDDQNHVNPAFSRDGKRLYFDCAVDSNLSVAAYADISNLLWTELAYDGFEEGFGNYTDGGADCLLYTEGTNACLGSNAADIQDNTASSTLELTESLDVASPGYDKIKVSFEYFPESMEAGEYFCLEYWDGGSWQLVRTWTSGLDYPWVDAGTDDPEFYSEEVVISKEEYTFSTQAKIRFVCAASYDTDDVYLDEIHILATKTEDIAVSQPVRLLETEAWGESFRMTNTVSSDTVTFDAVFEVSALSPSSLVYLKGGVAGTTPYMGLGGGNNGRQIDTADGMLWLSFVGITNLSGGCSENDIEFLGIDAVGIGAGNGLEDAGVIYMEGTTNSIADFTVLDSSPCTVEWSGPASGLDFKATGRSANNQWNVRKYRANYRVLAE